MKIEWDRIREAARERKQTSASSLGKVTETFSANLIEIIITDALFTLHETH
jgi:hypothetical protein